MLMNSRPMKQWLKRGLGPDLTITQFNEFHFLQLILTWLQLVQVHFFTRAWYGKLWQTRHYFFNYFQFIFNRKKPYLFNFSGSALFNIYLTRVQSFSTTCLTRAWYGKWQRTRHYFFNYCRPIFIREKSCLFAKKALGRRQGPPLLQ